MAGYRVKPLNQATWPDFARRVAGRAHAALVFDGDLCVVGSGAALN